MANTKEYFERVARRQATSIDRMLRKLRREDAKRVDGGLFQETFEDYLNRESEEPEKG